MTWIETGWMRELFAVSDDVRPVMFLGVLPQRGLQSPGERLPTRDAHGHSAS